MEVDYSRDAGTTGFTIYDIQIWCDPYAYGVSPFGWDDIAVDGHGMTISNLINVKWSLTDAQSNLSSSGNCSRVIGVNEHWGNPTTMKINWWFTEQLNNQHDFDDSIAITITNG
jgi:hypothetical protein